MSCTLQCVEDVKEKGETEVVQEHVEETEYIAGTKQEH